MLRWVCLCIFALLAASGCGGTSASTKKNADLETTIVRLESSSRKDRRKMRDLENQISVLSDKLTEARRQAVPVLPVEVVAPESPEPEHSGDDLEYQVVGVDEDGYEIVYVEDAAQPRSVKPRRLPEVRGENPPALEAAAPQTSRPIPAFADDERIEVTGEVGPKVTHVVRDAPRPAPVQSPPPSPPPAREKPAGARPKARSNTEAGALYKEYYDALKAGDHRAAIAGFRSFIERFPEHDFADNARYWLGEAFYDQRDYEAALGEFQRVVGDYPRGNKVPDALLKIGFCYLALGQEGQARSALARVIESFPDSKPAALAAQRLESLEHN